MLKVDKCLMANRLRIVQDKLSELATHFENLAEAGISVAKCPELGSPYEGARMLHEFAKPILMMAGDPNIDYDIVEHHMENLHVRVQAYIDLHKGLAIMNGLTSDWLRMADLLDMSKDLAKVDCINLRRASHMESSDLSQA